MKSSSCEFDVHDAVAEARTATLTRRLRLVAAACIGVTMMLLLVSVFAAGGVPDRFPQFRLASLAGAVLFVVLSFRPAFVPHQRLWGWLLVTGVAALAGLGAADRNSADVAAILETSILLLASAMLPWGLLAQGAAVASSTAVLAAVVWSVGPYPANHPDLPVIVIGIVSFGLSLFIAQVTRTGFDTATAENLRLHDARQRIRTQADELEATLADQREMTRAISHDLRQPLRHISGFARMLSDELPENLRADHLDRLERICHATARMDQMVDALLEISRVAGTSLERQRVDLSFEARAILAALQRSEPEREVQVVVQDGLVADGDPSLVRMLLHVLLDNAWKFTRNTVPARVQVRRDGEEFFVRDNGSGFDMRHASRMFATFERLHHHDEFEGEGVGLAIAARVVRRHGGRIRFESEPGKGATFRFTLGAVDGNEVES